MPGLVWSLDDAELARGSSPLLRLHQVQDLASRYKFTPWVGERIFGETVAARLEHLFVQHGPPLVLKRDNGSNLNQHAVEEVLARYGVLPLNSPPHYPPVQRRDGTRGAGTRRRRWWRSSAPAVRSRSPKCRAGRRLLAHDLNHRRRRSLQGHVACRVFQDARPALQAYTRRKRREVFEEINALTRTLMQAQTDCTPRHAGTARRLAVEAWLQKHGVISITQNHRVLPIFLEEIAHN